MEGYLLIILGLFVGVSLAVQLTILTVTIRAKHRAGFFGTRFINHAVIIGWDKTGRYVADQLVGVGKKLVIMTDKDNDVDVIKNIYHFKDVFVLLCDPNNFKLIKRANIDKAAMVFVNLEGDIEKLVYITNLKKVFPKINFVVTLENAELKGTFLAAGVSNTVSTTSIASKLLASYMFEPDVATYSESILSFAKSDDDYDMKQLLVKAQNPYNGKEYKEVFVHLKKRYNCVLLGITKQDKFGQKKLIRNPHGSLKVNVGDYLIVILDRKSFKQLRHVFAVEEGIQ